MLAGVRTPVTRIFFPSRMPGMAVRFYRSRLPGTEALRDRGDPGPSALGASRAPLRDRHAHDQQQARRDILEILLDPEQVHAVRENAEDHDRQDGGGDRALATGGS